MNIDRLSTANIYLSLKVPEESGQAREKSPPVRKMDYFEKKKFFDQYIFERLTWIPVNGFVPTKALLQNILLPAVQTYQNQLSA